jgi:HD-GYP domain-containing protein (c-di-GMP phosphodiesterase class II)
LPLEEAVAELRRNAGTQFDPVVVEKLLDVVEAAPTPAVE